MIGRAICSLVVLLGLASHGGELRVLSTVGERIALAQVVDLRASPTDEAQRADELLFEAFGGEMGLVYAGEVEESGAPEVWGPASRVRDFTPYLVPAADHGARAVLFVYIEESGDWSLHLVGIDGSLLEERFFAGSFTDVFPLVTAAAQEGFHRHFPLTTVTPVARGRLLIRCDGRGFTAAVDGNPVGVVPSDGLELRLSAGAHRLTIYNGDESPLETRFVSVVAEGLVVEEFFFGFDVEPEDDETGEAFTSCLFDVFFAAFCPPSESDDDSGSWVPGSDDDDDEVWGPTPDDERDDDEDEDEDGGGVWAPEP